ncbi:hypothetical protein Salat_2979400 [Sesamum alatum]|uniref:Uncharacterized protein n=1 Tax=Sesamum alatum TaxID=300844 RepID=A0AAE2C7V9_9LAMI|nr:hypothetical protein Salat_2979400 [Sesamum alatum]
MNCQIDQVRKHLESASAPGHLIGAASKTLLLSPTKKGSMPSPPTLYGRFLWYRRRLKYYLLFCRMMLTKPKPRTALCLVVLRGTPTTNYTFSFTLHSSSSKTRIWLLTRRGARDGRALNVIFYRSRKRTA